MCLWLNDLARSFQLRFQGSRDFDDISKAILNAQQAVYLTPSGNDNLPGCLINLGLLLRIRFTSMGNFADLSESISHLQEAGRLLPEDHHYKPSQLSSLGTSLGIRFESTGKLSDISEAISFHQKAVHLAPVGYINLGAFLNNLGMSFILRFTSTEDLTDITEAVSILQKAVDITPENHEDMPIRLDNLGNSLQARFEHTGDFVDISKSVATHRRAVYLTSEGHAELPYRLSNLGNSLRLHFSSTGKLTDLSEGISFLQKAVRLAPEGHAGLRDWLNGLGNLLRTRFDETGDLKDASEAISSLQKSVNLTPEGHADLPGALTNLAISFSRRFFRTKDPADYFSSIHNYRLCATHVTGPPSIRLAAAKVWIAMSEETDLSQLLEAYRTAINLVSVIAGLEETIQKRYMTLSNISELSTSAAAVAFRTDQPDLALEFLEQGRCLVWSQLNNLRTPLDDLRAHDAALADNILRVSVALENAGSRTEPAPLTAEASMIAKMSIQNVVTARVKLAEEWAQLLTEVRALPHFEDFLKPVSCSTLLKGIPNTGPVVVINIHKDRSDALALVSGRKPLHIPLPEFSYEQADTLRKYFKTHLLDSGLRMRGTERGMRHERSDFVKDVLGQLWIYVVKPILDGLGYSEPPPTLPRIWWCVTGPLAFLPIHAAGIYSPTESTPGIYTTLSDFAISSFTPTVKALVERVQRPRELLEQAKGLLMVGQANAPMLPSIPGTRIELRAIERLAKQGNLRYISLENDEATVTQVIAKMKDNSFIHLACHAAQETDDPLQSGFYLHDGRLNLLSIIKEKLVAADLAFLSACQTCAGDENLSEEAVHLAAGMLAAGYRSVVATMWSIDDRSGPKIAEEFYRHLLDTRVDDNRPSEGLSSDGAAYSLHYATRQIRKALGDSESSLLIWVPYVHFGL
ncbi:hypothetical protein GALMADRAFT_719832 [Galerina marginata CBS 339.88]|uniref:CHAT domain-containing protein n=1 Tax=Galerina marginata (strain CBS 339.88) TaxID=685588 RepID=A0A067TQN3_GALM3|nr:hypothetical protein GALMADRAFT_719832 [Galerina marginata CBS 339.88]